MTYCPISTPSPPQGDDAQHCPNRWPKFDLNHPKQSAHHIAALSDMNHLPLRRRATYWTAPSCTANSAPVEVLFSLPFRHHTHKHPHSRTPSLSHITLSTALSTSQCPPPSSRVHRAFRYARAARHACPSRARHGSVVLRPSARELPYRPLALRVPCCAHKAIQSPQRMSPNGPWGRRQGVCAFLRRDGLRG